MTWDTRVLVDTCYRYLPDLWLPWLHLGSMESRLKIQQVWRISMHAGKTWRDSEWQDSMQIKQHLLRCMKCWLSKNIENLIS